MKKTFQSPSLRTINVKAQNLMQASNANNGIGIYGTDGQGAAMSKEVATAGVWED